MRQVEQQQQIYSVKLTQSQRAFIQELLPKNYSLQQVMHVSQFQKSPTPQKKLMVNYRQDSQTQKQAQPETWQQKRKIKSYKNIEPQQKSMDKSCVQACAPTENSLQKMTTIVRKLKRSEYSWPFRMPVDSKVLNIPNYFEVVLVPIDLYTIQENLRNQKYRGPSEVERDIIMMFMNSYKFNDKNNQYFEATVKLEQYYHSLVPEGDHEIRKESKKQQSKPQSQESNKVQEYQKDLILLLKKANELQNAPTNKKNRPKHGYISRKNEGPVTHKERKQLLAEVRALDEGHLGRVLEIVRLFAKDNTNNHSNANIKDQKEEKEGEGLRDREELFSVDFDKLDQRTVRELQNYVRLQKNTIVHEKDESNIDSQQNNYSFY